MSEKSSLDEIPQALKAALSCLDLELETELALYHPNSTENPENLPEYTPSESESLPFIYSEEIISAEDLNTISLDIPASSDDSEVVPAIILSQLPLAEIDNSPKESFKNSQSASDSLSNQTEEIQPRGFLESLLTPLGLCSLIIFILGSALLGSALIEPLGLSKNPNPNQPQSPATVAETTEENPPIGNSPNLATEAENLELTTLPNANPSPLPTPVSQTTTQQQEITSQPQSDLASELLPPSLRKPVTSSTTETVKETPTPQSKNNNDYYYVIANYTGETSLKQAKKLVKDAYLMDLKIGTIIMMGAYERPEDAKRFVEQLKQKSFSASVYHP